jgi:energy-coupling factor transport system permease protein
MPKPILGQYHATNSPLHNLDPRVKITLLLVLFVAAFLATGLPAILILLALVAVGYLIARIPPRVALRSLAPLLVILIFPLVFNLLFVSTGSPLVHAGPLLITTGGVERAVFMTLRLLALFASAVLLMLTTTQMRICDAVAAMLAPLERLRFPATEVAMMASIALRFLPLLAENYARIKSAQVARGAALGGNPLARLKALPSILTPLFALAIIQAEDLAQAMESRCYHGAGRTHYHELRCTWRDAVAAVVVVAFVAVLVICMITGVGALS